MTAMDRLILGGGLVAVVIAASAAWLVMVPAEDVDGAAALLLASPAVADPEDQAAPSVAAAALVVDVEGGVLRPGIQQLPAGARVADAIAAAGGYGPRADLVAAASQLNLAQPLTDGQQVYVPLIGEATAGGPGAGGTAGGEPGGTGLVNLNTATPEQLDALPGIGPVTVQKIVAARAEQPFTSLEDALARKVIDRGQIEKIRDLATAN